jgi:hypothetical protein
MPNFLTGSPTTRQAIRQYRQQLTHAAGCAHRGGDFGAPCVMIQVLPALIWEYQAFCAWHGVRARVPKSLRHVEAASL